MSPGAIRGTSRSAILRPQLLSTFDGFSEGEYRKDSGPWTKSELSEENCRYCPPDRKDTLSSTMAIAGAKTEI